MNAPAKNSPAEPPARHIHPADLHGAGRLLLLAIEVLVDQVEVLHLKVLGQPRAPPGVGSVTGRVYRRAKWSVAVTGRWIDARLGPRRRRRRIRRRSARRCWRR